MTHDESLEKEVAKPIAFLKLETDLSSENANWITDNLPSIYRQIREQIAQEIEAFGILGEDDQRVTEMFFMLRESFAAIARGKK